MENKIDIDKLKISRLREDTAKSMQRMKWDIMGLNGEIDRFQKKHTIFQKKYTIKINNISNAILNLVKIVNKKGIVKQKDFLDVFARRSINIRFEEKSIDEIMERLMNKIRGELPFEEIAIEAKKLGISRTKTEDVLEELKRNGDIYEPKLNRYRML